MTGLEFVSCVLYWQDSDGELVYVAEVLANLTKESAKSRNSAMIKPNPDGTLGEMQVRLNQHMSVLWVLKEIRYWVPRKCQLSKENFIEKKNLTKDIMLYTLHKIVF